MSSRNYVAPSGPKMPLVLKLTVPEDPPWTITCSKGHLVFYLFNFSKKSFNIGDFCLIFFGTYSSVLGKWSLRAFTDAIQPIESCYLLSNLILIG